MNKTLFIIDVNQKVGNGHLSRSLKLIKILKKESKFYLLGEEKFFPKVNFKIFNVSLNKIKNYKGRLTKFNLIIVDSYRFRSQIMKFSKKISSKILLIDDFIKDYFGSNYLINQNPLIRKKDYKDFNKNKIFAGGKYTFIDLNFKRKKKINFKDIKIFVNCGLYDQKKQLFKILVFLNKLPKLFKFTCFVALSKKSVNFKKIKYLTNKNNRFYLIKNQSDYLKKLKSSNISICPLGVSVWERFQLGMPVFTFITDENQKIVFKRLQKNKNIFNFKYKEKKYKNIFLNQISNLNSLKKMSIKNEKIFFNNKSNLINVFKNIYKNKI